MKGIDVSENNGIVDFESVKNAGFEFVMIRVGYGNGHLDECFYRNVNEALRCGLQIGVYHYSYALNEERARQESEFVVNTLNQCGLTPDKLLGVYFDMEDADCYKERHGMPSWQTITNMCSIAVNRFWKDGYVAGIYANNDWLDNYIDYEQLGGCSLWLAEPYASEPRRKCNIWQYSFKELINGQEFDANILF
ncbi:MAG: GH25 family lysozyme [Dialister pneumosintes]